jgi:hypothetical protein
VYNSDDSGYDELEEQYAEWLEENCNCQDKEDGCKCPSFDKWAVDHFADIGDGLYEDYRDELERDCV